jgi:hypothetical protein
MHVHVLQDDMMNHHPLRTQQDPIPAARQACPSLWVRQARLPTRSSCHHTQAQAGRSPEGQQETHNDTLELGAIESAAIQFGSVEPMLRTHMSGWYNPCSSYQQPLAQKYCSYPL